MTAEDALKELRELFPRRWITITSRTHSAQAKATQVTWTISVDKMPEDFEATTLSDCMAQVREWAAKEK